jgi:hypothetical protein
MSTGDLAWLEEAVDALNDPSRCALCGHTDVAHSDPVVAVCIVCFFCGRECPGFKIKEGAPRA